MKVDYNIEQPHDKIKEPTSFKLISTLGIAGFIAGLVLVVVYLITLPIIEANKAEALQKAIFQVLPGTTSFQTLVLKNGKLIIVEQNQSAGKVVSKTESLNVYAGFDDSDKLIGFAIPGSEPGFQDIIGGIFGYDAVEKNIIGFEVLESKETPGPS